MSWAKESPSKFSFRHMIFDLKMDFTHKTCFIAGGHVTAPPSLITYVSVVSRDLVKIAFTLAALNGVDVQAADMEDAYLNTECKERIRTVRGPECCSLSLKEKSLIVVRALYGLKLSCVTWCVHLAKSLFGMGFKSLRADLDVWMQAASKDASGMYYEYILVYANDK